MENEKIRICIFIHYNISDTLPYYVNIYIDELSRHFDKVIVLTNNAKILGKGYSVCSNIEFRYFENLGYDFGMFYRFIITQNLNDFSQIAIVNDSNILINKLDSVFKNGEQLNADFWGLIDSYERPWFSTHKENYHIQSHFIIFNLNAIKYLQAYFELIDVQRIFEEKDPKQLRRLVIDQWEIGLSQFLLHKGLKCASIIDSVKFIATHKSNEKNITHSLYNELIKDNYPLIKKKVVLHKSWRSYLGKKELWQNSVSEYACHDWDISFLIEELKK